MGWIRIRIPEETGSKPALTRLATVPYIVRNWFPLSSILSYRLCAAHARRPIMCDPTLDAAAIAPGERRHFVVEEPGPGEHFRHVFLVGAEHGVAPIVAEQRQEEGARRLTP